jgi:hypothetical protein
MGYNPLTGRKEVERKIAEVGELRPPFVWHIFVEDLDNLRKFEYWINGEKFRELFVEAGGSENMARHLWDKFHGYDHSILKLWGAMDSKNKELVLKVIQAWLAKSEY